MKKSSMYLCIGSALLLSACGGGGGSSGTPTAGPAPVQGSTLSPITSANATRVAANAYAATSTISESSASFSDALTGVSIDRPTIGAVTPTLNLVKRAYARSAGQVLAGITISEPCSGGGSLTIEANLRNQQTVSNGDTMVIVANRCIEDGDIASGTMRATFSDISGDVLNSWVWSATLDTRYDNFSVTSGNESATVNGDMKIAVNQTSSTSSSVTVSGRSLQTTEQRSGTTIATRTLSDFSMTGSTRGLTITSAANFTMSGNTSALGQFSYTVRNVQPFVSFGGSLPNSGALIVNGASTAVTLTVAGTNSVRLDLSDKASGAITQTNTLSWTELLLAM